MFTQPKADYAVNAQSVPPLRFSLDDTSWFEFRSRRAQKEYDQYRIQEMSLRTLFAFLCFSTIVQFYYVFTATASRYSELIILIRCCRVSFLIPGWLLCWKMYKPTSNVHVEAPTLANTSILIFSITLCIILIVRTLIGECKEGENKINCNNNHATNSLPDDAVVSVLFSVVIFPTFIRCYHWWVLALSWFISLSSLLYSIVWKSATGSIYVIPVFLFIGTVIYQYERNTLKVYIAQLNMEHSIRTRMQAENERQVIEMRSVEMRHLLGNVAHDLKTPMQSFVMELELVSKMIKRPVSQTAELISYAAHDIRQMVSSLHNLTDTNSFMYMVINRAIDFAKSSSDRSLSPNLATINFVESIQWAVNMVKSKASLVPVTFEPVPSYICPHIITDKQWLIENILCLISNAAKFTTAGSVTVRCELIRAVNKPAHDDIVEQSRNTNDSSFSSSDELLIEVEDTGIGIPEEKRESMFQPFQQTMRMAGGTGLGLYSLRNRVDALKGSCGISDRRDGADGARIWFKIPYRPDETFVCDSAVRDDEEKCGVDVGFGLELSSLGHFEPVRSVDAESLDSISLSLASTSDLTMTPRSPRATILLVDDSLTIRKSISRVLMNEGLSVDLAENGQMALEMMGLKRYDLVLMDLQMPVMDGLEAVRRLRKQESESGGVNHQKVIGISAYTGEPYCSDAINAGMDGFIEKPFSAKRFMEVYMMIVSPLP